MHKEDAHDDNLIAMETSNQIHIRAQIRAAENAANSHILEIKNLNDNANSPLDVRNDTHAMPAANEARENAKLLPTILPPRATSGDDLAAHPLNTTKLCHEQQQKEPQKQKQELVRAQHRSTRKPC